MTINHFISLPIIRKGIWIERLPTNSMGVWLDRNVDGVWLAVGRWRVRVDAGDYHTGPVSGIGGAIGE